MRVGKHQTSQTISLFFTTPQIALQFSFNGKEVWMMERQKHVEKTHR
jgi:hypothetical protein